MSTVIEPPPWPLQDFEKELLIREVEALSGSPARWEGSSVKVAQPLDNRRRRTLIKRLAFAGAVTHMGVETATVQRKLEIAAGGTGKRKVTSHALHGLHPYKGKFYPQLARAILNARGVSATGRVLDPFAGSGTTLIEASLLGQGGRGLDANPLGVLVANTKLKSLSADPERLSVLLRRLETALPRNGMPLPDPYLERWFPPSNLQFLLRVMRGIEELADPLARAFALVCLSSVLRTCSWQEPSQIRVYRRKSDTDIRSLEKEFYRALEDGLEQMAATQLVLDKEGVGPRDSWAIFGDARRADQQTRGRFDAVVTSPPYANALPYIDTDRLSLRAFSLLDSSGQRGAEERLIGNREISDRQLSQLDVELNHALAEEDLPPVLRKLLVATKETAAEDDAGFRKRRTPGLLFAYFRDMKRVLTAVSGLLKPGAPAVFVVGDSTVAGANGERLAVTTADITVQLAERAGLSLEESFSKRLTSFGATSTRHQRNAMASETILVFGAPPLTSAQSRS
jgi:tRNA G10  N-methylase Trm11